MVVKEGEEKVEWKRERTEKKVEEKRERGECRETKVNSKGGKKKGEGCMNVYVSALKCMRMKKGCSGIAIVSLPQSLSKVRHALRGYTL